MGGGCGAERRGAAPHPCLHIPSHPPPHPTPPLRRYFRPPADYDAAFAAAKAAMADAFFGPPHGGVFSPSVQFTLFQMARAAIDRSLLRWAGYRRWAGWMAAAAGGRAGGGHGSQRGGRSCLLPGALRRMPPVAPNLLLALLFHPTFG